MEQFLAKAEALYRKRLAQSPNIPVSPPFSLPFPLFFQKEGKKEKDGKGRIRHHLPCSLPLLCFWLSFSQQPLK
jgi:hypothetical protein